MIELFTPAMAAEWNDFVSRSRQPSFLFDRGYMDYHSDRFSDFSLVARSSSGRILSLLPAERRGVVVTSHGGLTYGGWITPLRHFSAATMLDVMGEAVEFMHGAGVKELVYNPIPYIYCRQPAQEDIYALFRHGAQMTACGISSAIRLSSPAPMNESTRQGIKLAISSGVTAVRSSDFSLFWPMLCSCLAERHNGAAPTHTLAEMELLSSRFPDRILLYLAYKDGEPVAGAVVYVTERVVHTQYLATTAEGRRVKALALLINQIAAEWSPSKAYLDFGTSTERGGELLNRGLLLQKSGHGALGVAMPVYSMPV